MKCDFPINICTFGCAKNEVDSRDMSVILRNAGYYLCSEPDDASLLIINTCAFITEAVEENLEFIFTALNNDRKVVVTGCLPARYGTDLYKLIPEVYAFLPCDKESEILYVVDRAYKESNKRLKVQNFTLSSNTSAFAYIKIAEGCSRKCSYCMIPVIRGKYRSFSYADILKECRTQINAGASELILVAQDTGLWGIDLSEKLNITELLENLAVEFSNIWIRLMYIQPSGITDELLACIASHENICSYLDIPLQHANKEIIHSMNRQGGGKEYLDILSKIRKTIPNVVIRTTLIAGYPGESDSEFEELCEFVKDAEFDYVGVFPYSLEDETEAAKIPFQINDNTKLHRAQELRDLCDNISFSKFTAKIDEVHELIIQGYDEQEEMYVARGYFQSPDSDGVTYVSSSEPLKPGQHVKAKIIDSVLYDLFAEIV